ncbi:hypothetical protein [Streptomyces sp. NBC_00299]|uniref:hypothetical protein n=1 Tax=Streptomyces sp. NBC_00299 TaxID=2975705 RepID=UPI002E2919DB|nr:hypothetical protein [Streptomyces sp. NBC_00299]
MYSTSTYTAAHTLAGGGAGALRDAFGEGVLRAAFADGLDSVTVVAGSTAAVAGVLVLALVRRPTATKAGVTPPATRTLTEEAAEETAAGTAEETAARRG